MLKTNIDNTHSPQILPHQYPSRMQDTALVYSYLSYSKIFPSWSLLELHSLRMVGCCVVIAMLYGWPDHKMQCTHIPRYLTRVVLTYLWHVERPMSFSSLTRESGSFNCLQISRNHIICTSRNPRTLSSCRESCRSLFHDSYLGSICNIQLWDSLYVLHEYLSTAVLIKSISPYFCS